MNEEAEAYIEYLGRMEEVAKPVLPKFDQRAYTENEYIRAIKEIDNDFLFVDSFDLTIQHLKGEWWK